MDGRRSFEQVGLLPMPVEHTWAALKYLIDGQSTQKMVASVAWDVLKPVYESKRPSSLLQEIVPEVAHDDATAMELVRDRSRLQAFVEAEVRRVLDADPSQELDLYRGFFDMGMDSLMSVRLKGRLEAGLGISLPSTLTFTYPTIEALVDYLAGEIGPAEDASDDAIEAALIQELENTGY
jgi:acyl carrier protein